jgi:hypothetical protein
MKTSVEWLQMMLIPTPYDEEDFEHNKKCWEQAKEMEKEHKIDFALTVYSEIVETDKDFVDVIKSMNL